MVSLLLDNSPCEDPRAVFCRSTGKCYCLNEYEKTFDEAAEKCSSGGGGVVTIPNLVTNTALRNLIPGFVHGAERSSVWIGATTQYATSKH